MPQPQVWNPSGETAVVDAHRATYAIAADAGLGAEGYALTIGADGAVSATAPTEAGLRWARRTVDQLAGLGRPVPCGRVRDWPKYGVRGVMLDVGRKFMRLETLRAIVRDLAHYKMNELHVHLNDDGAPPFVNGYSCFRLECETFPELTAKDGHYTKAEFRAFMKESAALGVTIVPEIDTPAHSGSIIKIRPSFEGRYGGTHLALDKPEVRTFIEKLFAEYLDGPDPVFAGTHVHVGTDEYDKREAENFRAYTDWIFKMVRRHGHEPRAWGSLDHAAGKTPVVADRKIVMDIWHNPYYDPVHALKAGYSIVAIPDVNLYVVPAAGYYFDYLDVEEIFRTWEPRVMGFRTLAGDEPGLLGGKFAIWNDLSGNGISEDDVIDRAFHAVPTIAEKTWTGDVRDLTWPEFRVLAAQAGEAPGVNLFGRLTGKDGTAAAGDRSVGWCDGGYRVGFDLVFDAADRDLVLFDDGTSQVKVFKGGRLGFARDGYAWTSDVALAAGKTHRVVFCGDRVGVTLEVDGKLVGDTHGLTYKGKRKVRTLHFPLVATPNAAARTSRLEVATGERFAQVAATPADDWDLDALGVLDAPAPASEQLVFPVVAKGRTCPGVVLVGGPNVPVRPEDVKAWSAAGYAVAVVGDFAKRSDRDVVSEIVQANARLRSHAEVDSCRIGLVAASRDGSLPGVVTGADRRFAFAVSVFDRDARELASLPRRYVERARGPFIFVDSTGEAAARPPVNELIPDWKSSRVALTDGEKATLSAKETLSSVARVFAFSD